jgi:hypothetical protein
MNGIDLIKLTCQADEQFHDITEDPVNVKGYPAGYLG